MMLDQTTCFAGRVRTRLMVPMTSLISEFLSHWNMDFEPVRDYTPFQELMRPKR